MRRIHFRRTYDSTVSGNPTKTYTYNDFGELTSATVNAVTTTYSYRPDGLRKSKDTLGATTTHVWDGDDVVMDLNLDRSIKAKYPRGINLIELDDGTAAKQQYSFNYHGDVISTVNSSTGDRIGYDYDAYGNQASLDEDNLNPFRYSGEYYDSETGFIYLRARYYDTTNGRFLTEDPARDGINWYAYCAGNPLMYKDPSGYLKEGDKERFGETSIKYQMLRYLGSAWKYSIGRAAENKKLQRNKIENIAEKLRGYDDSSFVKAVLINGEKMLEHLVTML